MLQVWLYVEQVTAVTYNNMILELEHVAIDLSAKEGSAKEMESSMITTRTTIM